MFDVPPTTCHKKNPAVNQESVVGEMAFKSWLPPEALQEAGLPFLLKAIVWQRRDFPDVVGSDVAQLPMDCCRWRP